MKKILTSLLCVVMVLCMMPGMAWADAATYQVNDMDEFKDAITNASNGDTIILTADISGLQTKDIVTIPNDKSLILNLNGKSITVDASFEGRPIVNEGTLTVTGNGTIDSSASEFGGYGAINNYGTLTIENGTFRGSIMADASAVYVRPGSEATINGGEFTGTRAVSNDGTLKVYGGNFKTTSCTETKDSKGETGYCAYCVVSSGELYFYNGTVTGVQGGLAINSGYAEVYDGDFKTVACEHSATGQYSYYALYIAGEINAVEAHILGGTYTSASREAVLCGNDNTGGDGGNNQKATAYISGGTFIGGGTDKTALKAGSNTGDPRITEGAFSSDVSAYVPDGTEMSQNSENLYVLAPSDEAVAQIGDAGFKSLEKALATAANGDTIKILKDIQVDTPINVKKELTFEGVDKADGTKVKISGAKGIFSQTGDAEYTLKNLNLEVTSDGSWYIYHSANRLTVDNCAFIMADGVTSTGNIVMGEGSTKAGSDYSLSFTNNTVLANSRAAITGIGNNSVITDNTIDLISEKYGNTDSRTSVLGLTASAGNGAVTITGNTFKNANRVLGVDHSDLAASDITYSNNKFIDTRYALEISPEDNKDCGTYDINNNYYEFNNTVSEPKIENADIKNGNHFTEGDGTTEYKVSEENNLVQNDVYYTKDTMRPEDLSNYTPSYIPSVPSVQSPTVTASEGVTTALSSDGTKVTITVADGYELVDVTVNGVSKGTVTTLTGLKTGDKIVVTAQKKADNNAALIEAVKNTRLIARSAMSAAKGKKAVKVYWYAEDGSDVDFDGYEVYRSLKRYSGFGKSPFFETANEKYYNTAIKKGTKYYYKVRAYKVIDGEKIYTDWSTKAWRTVK